MNYLICTSDYWNALSKIYPANMQETLKKAADLALDKSLLSVTFGKKHTLTTDLHDYVSLSPYHWPNPNTPDGFPWIQKDGVINPEYKNYDGPKIRELCARTGLLVSAGHLTGNIAYFQGAARLLKCWFLNPETAMNSHFRYAQFVPGNQTGSCWGLIDSSVFCELLEAVASLPFNIEWSEEDLIHLKEWFTRYYFWYVSDEFAIKEEKAPTNHGTAYDRQFIVLTLFLGQPDLARRQIREKTIPRLSVQLLNNGMQPFEMYRTRSLSYSIGNLSHWARIAVYSKNLGIPLWEYPSDDNATLKKCYEFLYPHLLDNGKNWPYLELAKASIHGERLISFCKTFLMSDCRQASIQIPETPCMLSLN